MKTKRKIIRSAKQQQKKQSKILFSFHTLMYNVRIFF